MYEMSRCGGISSMSALTIEQKRERTIDMETRVDVDKELLHIYNRKIEIRRTWLWLSDATTKAKSKKNLWKHYLKIFIHTTHVSSFYGFFCCCSHSQFSIFSSCCLFSAVFHISFVRFGFGWIIKIKYICKSTRRKKAKKVWFFLLLRNAWLCDNKDNENKTHANLHKFLLKCVCARKRAFFSGVPGCALCLLFIWFAYFMFSVFLLSASWHLLFLFEMNMMCRLRLQCLSFWQNLLVIWKVGIILQCCENLLGFCFCNLIYSDLVCRFFLVDEYFI